MASMLNVSLFLPSTIAFHESPEDDRRDSRTSDVVQLDRKAPIISTPLARESPTVFRARIAASTPPIIATNEELLSSKVYVDQKKSLFAKSDDPRSLARSDASVSEWGAQAIFNQPRSRAGPLPSRSILDFAEAHEEITRQKRQESVRRLGRSTSAQHPRNKSHDRGFEERTWTVEPALLGNGGLTNAIRSAVENGELDCTYIGTIGCPTDELSDSLKEDIHDKFINEHESVVVYCSDKDLDGHYAHYCKTILWPIFHYQVPDHPKSKAYADHSWEFYRNVNQAFADKVVATYKRGDSIWIHDYHLLLVPGMGRQKLPDAQIGFFLHTAFPSSEVFRCLSTRNELLEGLLGANLIAFQTDEYAEHFLQTCSRLLTVETTKDGVQLDDHFVNVTSEPIGINPTAMEEARQVTDVQKWITAIQEKYKDKKIIVARDKLDNIRGVRQKLLAYELFLNQHPEWTNKVVMIQVATSTNQQSELMATVSDICTRIDAEHSSLAHQPLVFLKQDIAFSQYLALLSVADVLMISSLRDGMNLTAHEYVFCQDGSATKKKHGPLILSEFTGSHAVFARGHISINPWDYKQQANAIAKALEMDQTEKVLRWSHLHNVVMRQTGGRWISQLQKRLVKVYEEHARHASSSVPRLSFAKVSEGYKSADRRIFIIDYEGTLSPNRTSSGIPLSQPQRVLDTLTDLTADSKNIVYIMSGYAPEELETTFRTLPSLGLIAENGCFLREFGVAEREWQDFVEPEKTAKWKSDVRVILQYYVDRLEGSYIEERHCSLLFRYEKSDDQEAATRCGGESADQINSACKSMRIQAVPVDRAILIEQIDFNKSTAMKFAFDQLNAQSLVRRAKLPDFMLVAGDDREDEAVFHWANNLNKDGTIREVFTISVGKRNTEAQSTLTQGSTGLLTTLQKLGKISTDDSPLDYFNQHRTN